MSLNPYEQGERLALSAGKSRDVEAWALFELAKRLERVRVEVPEDKDTLLEVMRLNWRVWTLFQASLLSEESKVELKLRGNLLTLCAFIDKHSSQFLTDPKAEKLQVLININKHLGHGLRGNRGIEGAEGAEGVVAAEQKRERDRVVRLKRGSRVGGLSIEV